MRSSPAALTARDAAKAVARAAKPKLRGRLHQVAFFASIPAGAALVAAANPGLPRVAAVVYALSMAALFGTSAAYHRLPWGPRGAKWMQRLDHSMIFVLIAGTYTPFSLLVLRGWLGWTIFGLVWGGAVVGAVLKLFTHVPAAVGSTLYIVLGWLAIIGIPQMIHGTPVPVLGLILAGGILYTLGALILLRRRPDPVPAVFGYHEVWHSMTIAAAACIYAGVLMVLLEAH